MSFENKLYEEMGRAFAEHTSAVKRNQELSIEQRREQMEMSARHVSERQQLEDECLRHNERLEILQEAVRLTTDGMDPVLAKLKAKESLEERKKDMEKATLTTIPGGSINIAGKVNPGTWYGGGMSVYSPPGAGYLRYP